MITHSALKTDLKKEQASFISSTANWDWFVTLTFANEVTPRYAHARFHLFCKRLAKRSGGHIRVAWAWNHRVLPASMRS